MFARTFGAVAIRVFEITALAGQVIVLAIGILALAVSRVCKHRPARKGVINRAIR
jgi:hypothetical protein